MADLNSQETHVLDKEGISIFAKQILAEVNKRIDKRIVSELNEDSDEKHVPSAKAMYKAVSGVDNVMALVIADGDITKAQITPDERTLYVVRKSPSATEGTPWIYLKPFGFVKACTGADGSDISILPISAEEIIAAVDRAAAETDPDLGVLTAQLKITYVGPNDGIFVVPTAVVMNVEIGSEYNVVSPTVEGYIADQGAIIGTMTASGFTTVVTYTKNE